MNPGPVRTERWAHVSFINWECRFFPTLERNPSRMLSISRKKASESFLLVPNEILGPVSFPEGKQDLAAAGEQVRSIISLSKDSPPRAGSGAGPAPPSWEKQCQELSVPVIWSPGGADGVSWKRGLSVARALEELRVASLLLPRARRALCAPVHGLPRSKSSCRLLAEELGGRFPGMTQISGRSPLTPSRSRRLCVDGAECRLECPSCIPPAPAAVTPARRATLANPGASHSSRGGISHPFLIPGRCTGWPSGIENPEAWAGPPSVHHPRAAPLTELSCCPSWSRAAGLWCRSQR